jgi:hypothetical protein
MILLLTSPDGNVYLDPDTKIPYKKGKDLYLPLLPVLIDE